MQLGETTVELLTNQNDSDMLFGLWTKALLNGSSQVGNAWIIDGCGVNFSNYGHGAAGAIENEVMLGVDKSKGAEL